MLLHLFSHSYYWLNRFAPRFFFLFFVSPFSLTAKPGLSLPPSRVWIGMVPQIGKVKLTESLPRQYFFRRSAH